MKYTSLRLSLIQVIESGLRERHMSGFLEIAWINLFFMYEGTIVHDGCILEYILMQVKAQDAI